MPHCWRSKHIDDFIWSPMESNFFGHSPIMRLSWWPGAPSELIKIQFWFSSLNGVDYTSGGSKTICTTVCRFEIFGSSAHSLTLSGLKSFWVETLNLLMSELNRAPLMWLFFKKFKLNLKSLQADLLNGAGSATVGWLPNGHHPIRYQLPAGHRDG